MKRHITSLHAACLGLSLMTAAGCQEDGSLPLPSSIVQQRTSKGVSADACSDPIDAAGLRLAMLNAVNAEREQHRLAPLQLNSTLDQVADFYACRLVDGGFFSHVDPFDGSTVATRSADFGYAFWKIGENLAAGQPSVERAVSDWMSSPGHRANILDPAYTELGIAVKTGGENGPYWVQEFGRPITEGPAPAPRVDSSPSSEQMRKSSSQPVTNDALPGDPPPYWH